MSTSLRAARAPGDGARRDHGALRRHLARRHALALPLVTVGAIACGHAPPPVAEPAPSGVSRAGLSWPVAAPLSSPFGRRDGRPHDGIDLSVPDGTPVRAAAPGRVVYAGARLRGYGNLLLLRHDDHLMTVYAHNQRLLVGEGATVERGQAIALSGHTGRVTAPHLHFEVRVDGRATDPLPLLPAAPASPPRLDLTKR